ncbi:MAG: hypothetical protein U0263_35385 [Polyangiaceae bacterium]
MRYPDAGECQRGRRAGSTFMIPPRILVLVFFGKILASARLLVRSGTWLAIGTCILVLTVARTVRAQGMPDGGGDGGPDGGVDAQSVQNAVALPPKAVLDFQLENAKVDFKRAHDEVETLSAELRTATTPSELGAAVLEGDKFATSVQALRARVRTPINPAKDDCSNELRDVDRAAETIRKRLHNFLPFVFYGRPPDVVQL